MTLKHATFFADNVTPLRFLQTVTVNAVFLTVMLKVLHADNLSFFNFGETNNLTDYIFIYIYISMYFTFLFLTLQIF